MSEINYLNGKLVDQKRQHSAILYAVLLIQSTCIKVAIIYINISIFGESINHKDSCLKRLQIYEDFSN